MTGKNTFLFEIPKKNERNFTILVVYWLSNTTKGGENN